MTLPQLIDRLSHGDLDALVFRQTDAAGQAQIRVAILRRYRNGHGVQRSTAAMRLEDLPLLVAMAQHVLDRMLGPDEDAGSCA
ncbi:MAG: hypothetical protein ACKVS8_11045 [Phycisphaerales bacterium]